MKKNKKLKNQFKKLLNEQIHKAIKENPDFREEKKEQTKEDVKKSFSSENETGRNFAKKDILKTIIVSSSIITIMIIFAFVLNKYGFYEKATNAILNIMGAK